MVTLSAVGVTPTRPDTVIDRLPLMPGVIWNDCEPLTAVVSAWTSDCAAISTGRRAMGLRTVCEPPVQIRAPCAQALKAALPRVNVTWKVASAPGARVI